MAKRKAGSNSVETTPGWEWVRQRAEAEAQRLRGGGVGSVSGSEPEWLTLHLPQAGGPLYLRRIPAGEFLMGSRSEDSNEQPQHRVVIPRSFYLGGFPVTQGQFRAFGEQRRREHENSFSGSPLLPAVNMDWDQAAEFCRWITGLANELKVPLPSGWFAALPTEAQWEYACRGRSSLVPSGSPVSLVPTDYFSGDGRAALAEVGWYGGNSQGQTWPVGSLPRDPSTGPVHPWDLFDLHGNVWEWCVDPWDPDAYRQPNRPSGAVDPGSAEQFRWFGGSPAERSSAPRVIRGGSWVSWAGICRSAYRIGREPGDRDGNRGFRLCLLPGPGAQPTSASPEPSGGASPGERGGVKPTQATPARPAADNPPRAKAKPRPPPPGDDFEALSGPPRPGASP